MRVMIELLEGIKVVILIKSLEHWLAHNKFLHVKYSRYFISITVESLETFS